MTVVVDSDVLIGVLRRQDGARKAMVDASRAGERIVSVAPVRTEVLRGLLPGEEEVTAALLGLVEWIGVDAVMADHAGELGRAFRPTHPTIEVVDLLLAATAQRLAGRVLTRNVRHFPMFPGLAPAY